jgi:orotate phosphoribosyltransferase
VTTGASITEATDRLIEAGFEVLGAATVSATVRRLSSY